MDKKLNRKSHREVTHLSSELCSKLRSAEFLYNSLSAGSKNRLTQYRKNLIVTRGGVPEEVLKDKEVEQMLKRYVWDKQDFEEQVSYLRHVSDKDGYPFSRNLKVYSSIEDAMTRFGDKDHTSFRWNQNYQQSLETLRGIFRRAKLQYLVYNSDDDIEQALPKLDTHSGYFWIISGNKKKGDNMEGIHTIFQEELESALTTGTFNKPLLLGFRTQASGEYEDDGEQTGKCKHKLRVVSMVDLVVIVAELIFAKPVQDFMATQNFYAGGKDATDISGIITNWKVKYDKFMSIDYSSFDQTISSWLIEDAFSVIREAFVLDERMGKLFDVVVHDFVHKDFVLEEGILHSDKGVPSGSMFTQIIDTIVNVIVVLTYFNAINSKAEMIVMGDDNAIFTNDPHSIEDMADYIMKNFGLVVKTDDKSNEGSTKRDDVKFLSRYWRWDGQWRNSHQLLSRLLYPERFRNYSTEVGPEHVIFAFILTYRLGMHELLDISRFLSDYPISDKYIMDKVDSRYLPGSMAYIREYTLKKR